jgi:hypothetical protein
MRQTEQGPRLDGQPEAVFNQKGKTAGDFVNERRAALMANNKDNVAFETGAMRLRGNDATKAGTIVRPIRGASVVGATVGNGFTAEY